MSSTFPRHARHSRGLVEKSARVIPLYSLFVVTKNSRELSTPQLDEKEREKNGIELW